MAGKTMDVWYLTLDTQLEPVGRGDGGQCMLGNIELALNLAICIAAHMQQVHTRYKFSTGHSPSIQTIGLHRAKYIYIYIYIYDLGYRYLEVKS